LKTLLQLNQEVIELKRIVGTIQSDLSLVKLEGRQKLIPLMVFNLARACDALRVANLELKLANIAKQDAINQKKRKKKSKNF
jgi:hypothetical protein